MTDIPNIDPDFEPQARPRAGTWPLKRPDISSRKSRYDNDVSMKLEPTIEEATSQEQLMTETMMSSGDNGISVKQENQNGYILPNAFPSNEFSNGLVNSPTASCAPNYSSLLMSGQQPSPSVRGSENGSNNLSFTSLEPMTQSKPICNYGAVGLNASPQSNLDIKPNVTNENSPGSDFQQQLSSTTANGDITAATGPVVSKPKTSSRKNAWGNMSYADLITQGIESSPDKRLTLAQIYNWMVKNVPYFKDKGDSNSSAGWKNSIRHNLSLHSKFKRIQNEGTGKSSWWVINHDAKPGKPSRRRTTSLDTNNHKLNKSRARALSKKNELQKKLKGVTKRDSPTWARSPTAQDGSTDFEHPLGKTLSDFRPRTSSNASSLGGRMSPPRSLLTQDLEDDGPPPLSPLSSSYNPGSFDLFGRNDTFSLVPDLDPLASGASDLLENISIDALNPTSPMTQCPNDNRTNIYLTSAASGQGQIPGVVKASSNANRGLVSSPNLASLLQHGVTNSSANAKLQALNNKNNQPTNKVLTGVDISGSLPRARSNTMPRLQPQPKYNMSDSLRRQQSGDPLASSQDSLLFPNFTSNDSQPLPSSPQNVYAQYQYNRSQQSQVQQQQQQMIGRRNDDGSTMSQSQMNTNRPQINSMSQQRQQNCSEASIPLPSYTQASQVQPQQSNTSNLMQMNQKYPSDLDLDNQDIFNPGAVNLDELMYQEMEPPSSERISGMDFNSYFPQDSRNLELVEMDNTMDTSNSVGRGMSNNAAGAAKLSGSGFTYSNNQVTMESLNIQPQQRYVQQTPNGYNMNLGAHRSSQVLMTPSSGAMLVGGQSDSIMGGTGLPQHFTHQHLRPQSSVGAISNYRM